MFKSQKEIYDKLNEKISPFKIVIVLQFVILMGILFVKIEITIVLNMH